MALQAPKAAWHPVSQASFELPHHPKDEQHGFGDAGHREFENCGPHRPSDSETRSSAPPYIRNASTRCRAWTTQEPSRLSGVTIPASTPQNIIFRRLRLFLVASFKSWVLTNSLYNSLYPFNQLSASMHVHTVWTPAPSDGPHGTRRRVALIMGLASSYHS